MTEKTDLANIFILLELDPDEPWNQAEFERQLQKKRQEWSRQVNMPTRKGIQAKQNLGLIPELQKIAGDEALRRTQAAEARKLKEKDRADKLREFEERLELLQAKGHILEDELKRLVKDFAGFLSESEIRKHLKVPVEKWQASDRSRKAALEPAKAKDIERKLQGLGNKDLYDFLGMANQTESRLLLQRARVLYDGVQKKASKTPQDTLISELSGYCLDIFKSEAEQAKYDETLRLQDYDQLKKKVDLIGEVSNQVDAKQMEQLLREAREKGLNLDEARAIILEHAAKKGYAVFVSDRSTQVVGELQRCGYCSQLNDRDKQHCIRCGQPLKELCPGCSQLVPSENMACGACGFPVGNRSWVKVLINEADQARKNRDYEAAVGYLEQAHQAWPTPTDSQHPLANEIRELKAKVTPDKEAQESLLKEMETAIQEKRFYEARSLLPRVRQVLPVGSAKADEYLRRIEPEIQQAEAKLAQARRARTSNPEETIQIYQDVLRICRDCQEARDMLAKTPPSPPAAAQATVGGEVIHLSWQPSRSQGVKYDIVRKCHSRPVSAIDGEKLATVAGTVYDDTTPEPGIPLFYAIFSDREGVPSRDGATLSQPVMILQEVRDLTRQVGDQQVHLMWKPPPNVHDILVVRSERGYPRAVQDGRPVPVLDNSQAIDNQVQNEHRYFYTVFCQFKDYGGKLQRTAGIQVDAVPQQPPTPIKAIHISSTGPAHARQVQLRWPPPAKGDVVVVKSEESTGLQLGQIIPQQDLSKYGQVLVTSSNQISDKISRLGIYYFLPVIVFQGSAYIGQEQKYVCVEDVSGLSVQNLGHALRLQWQWPPSCQEVLVAFSYQDWPKPDQPDTTTIPLTRAQYDLRGYYDISNPVQADHYIIVFAIIGQPGQKIVAAGESNSARKRVSLMSRITLGYKIKKARFTKKFTLEIAIKGQGTLPSLVLIGKQRTLPLNKSDGETLLRLESASIQGESLSFILPEGSSRRQSYAKLFLEDDDLYDVVTIRHPSLEEMRLF